MALLAGLLMALGAQASDIEDGSKSYGFLSKSMPKPFETSQSSIGDTGKFMAHHVNNKNREGRTEALVYDVDNALMTYSTVSDKEEGKAVQKLLPNESNKPIGLSAIGIALLSFGAMLGVRLRRGVQPAIVKASSSEPGIAMSIPMASVSHNRSAHAQDMHADSKGPFAFFDPLGLGESASALPFKSFRESEIQHGRVAMNAVFLVSPQKSSTKQTVLQAAQLSAKEKEEMYWSGDWVCADCGYVYDRRIFGGRYFEEQTFGFKCPQCSGPRRRYAKMVGDTVGVTLDGGDGPILLASGIGFLFTIALGFYISNSDF